MDAEWRVDIQRGRRDAIRASNNSYLTSCIPPPLPTKQLTECNSVERLITQETTGTPWQLVDISPPPPADRSCLSSHTSPCRPKSRLPSHSIGYQSCYFCTRVHYFVEQHIVRIVNTSSIHHRHHRTSYPSSL